MNLPKPNYTAPLRQSYQAQFGGLNHTKGASDGDIYDMRNMTSDHYPVLSPRDKRFVYAKYDAIYGLYAYGADTYIVGVYDDTPGIYREDMDSLVLLQAQYDFTPDEKQMEVIAGKLIIFPDKVYFDLTTEELKTMEPTVTGDANFGSGELNGSRVNWNELRLTGKDLSEFRVGDAVTISGCTEVPANNKTAIIREIHDDRLEFSEYCFTSNVLSYRYYITSNLSATTDGMLQYYPTYGFYHGTQLVSFQLFDADENSHDALAGGYLDWEIGSDKVRYHHPTNENDVFFAVFDAAEGSAVNKELDFEALYTDPYEEINITITREIPDFDYILAVNNRLWGAKGDTVWGSKLGDPTNWNYFDGLSVDSYSVNLGSAGDITGIANYNGYPTFFKENGIYKLYGAYPSAFQMYSTATTGVKAGCGKSIAKIGEALYYVSKNGVMMYAGGVPRYIGNELGVRISNAVGGTDGRKYYLCADGLLYVYDTYMGLWHIEDEVNAMAMSYGDDLVCVTADGYIMTLGHSTKADEADVLWMVQFADAVVGSPNKKGVEKVLIRAVCDEDAYCDVYISFDHGEYEHIRKITHHTKATDILPIVLKRGDNFSLKLIGKGLVDIYSLSYHYYNGSER